MTDRIVKLNAHLRDVLAQIIAREVDFRGLFVTVVKVELSPTMEHAAVSVSVLPENQGHNALEDLEYAIGDIQHELNNKLKIHPVPKISFKIDNTEAQAMRVEKLIQEGLN